MAIENYASYWNDQAGTAAGAVAAVDNSGSEDAVRQTGQWTAVQMRAALDLQPSHHVLELGCGVGRIGRELVEHVGHWHGVDISQSMLDVAAERLAPFSNVSLTRLERTSLEMLDSDSFDRVYSVAVLCHIDKEDLYLYLHELHRVLKPGGLMYVETWNLDDRVGWKRWEYEVANWKRSDQSQRKPVGRNQFCAPQEFGLYLQHAGFDSLVQYADSPWVQAVAGKQLGEPAAVAERERQRQCQQQVAYSRQWGDMFGEFIDVLYGVMPPNDMLERLDAREQDAEVALYRDYLLSQWSSHPHWGPVPK